MVKNIVLDNGNVIHYVNDINEYKPQSIDDNIMYELADSYNPTDLYYLTFKKFEFIERDLLDFNELKTKTSGILGISMSIFYFYETYYYNGGITNGTIL